MDVITPLSGLSPVIPYTFDDDLMDRALALGKPAIRVCPFDHRAVVAGRGSDIEREIRTDRTSADGIPVYRRRGGGCSVFLDPGNLMVSLAFPAPGFGAVSSLFDRCTRWLLAGFRDLGLPGIYRDGICDLVLEDRKIGGACLFRSRGMAYYSAAILVAPDLDLMDHYLAHPPREPGYRRGRAHRDFVRGLAKWMPGISVPVLAWELRHRLGLRIGVTGPEVTAPLAGFDADSNSAKCA